MNTSKGFTLIELLVVISIIGILSSVILASLSAARMKSRDARRIADIDQIRTALEMYYDEKAEYPAYRPRNSCGDGIGRVDYAMSTCADPDWLTASTSFSTYLTRTPKDPLNKGSTGVWWGDSAYMYTTDATGSPYTKYDLVAQLESPGNPRRCEITKSKWNERHHGWVAPVANQYCGITDDGSSPAALQYWKNSYWVGP